MGLGLGLGLRLGLGLGVHLVRGLHAPGLTLYVRCTVQRDRTERSSSGDGHHLMERDVRYGSVYTGPYMIGHHRLTVDRCFDNISRILSRGTEPRRHL